MTSRRRKSPNDDAVEHLANGKDKVNLLEVKFINLFKGELDIVFAFKAT